MQRATSSLTLAFAIATGLATVKLAGCGPGETVGPTGSTGGTAGRVIAGSGGGAGATRGSGGTGSPGSGGSVGPGSGGSVGPGSGGSVGPGSGGTGNPGTGGTGAPGTGGRGGAGGTVTGTGGGMTGTGGAAGPGGNRACAAASADVISDFEEGYGVMVRQGDRTGFWYTYSDGTDGMNQTPPKQPPLMADRIPVEASGDTNMCNKWSFHSTATGHPMYVGFGAAFKPAPLADPPNQMKSPYDVSSWDGITFKAKTGGGATSQPLYFEMLARESQPNTSGGTATVTTIDLYNTRGQIVTVNSTTYTQYYVPFGTLIPRWMPAVGSGMVCPAAGSGVPKCQAARFNPMNALGIQFSFYNDPGFPKPNPAGAYNIWVDDVAFYKRSASTPDLPAAPTSAGAMHPFPNNSAVNSRCGKPTQANALLLTKAYNNWKTSFVRTNGSQARVIRPAVETGSGEDTVSEGIGYGMLISVYMNDKTLFDGLWTYWKANCAVNPNSNRCLMTWRIGGAGGMGSASDADTDAAFALVMAARQWGGSYGADATALIGAIKEAEVDTTAPYLRGGSNYRGAGLTRTNPSYFSPAFYRVFAQHTGDTSWNTLANNVYNLLGSISNAGGVQNGLVPAWCNSSCTGPESNGASTDNLYQYDSHRTPWRIGMDYCWYGTAAAQSYLMKVIPFFANTAGGNGVGRIFDLYDPTNSREASGAAVNSASLIGMAASGAMFNASTYRAFLDDGYQLVFDLLNRGTLAELGDGTKSAYSYFNATVGMMALLTMTGEFALFP